MAARLEVDEPRLGALALDTATEIGEHELRATFRHGAASDVLVEAHVRRRKGDREHLTCTGGTGRPWVYETVAVDVR